MLSVVFLIIKGVFGGKAKLAAGPCRIGMWVELLAVGPPSIGF